MTRKEIPYCIDRRIEEGYGRIAWTLIPHGADEPNVPVVLIVNYDGKPTYLFEEDGSCHDIKHWNWSADGYKYLYVGTNQ